MSIPGHLVGVTTDRFGSELTADLAISDTVVHVASTIFFNETEGGTLLLNGSQLAYEAFDDPDADDDEVGDTDGPTELTLTEPSPVGADAGDRVYELDSTTGGADPVQELTALVTIDDRDGGDALPARVRTSLAEQLDSDVQVYLGKAVELERRNGELILTDILGSRPTPTSPIRGAEDPFVITADTTHPCLLTHVPVAHTEHVEWGINQDETQWSRTGKLLTVDDPDQLGQDGDLIVVKYLYLEAGQPAATATPTVHGSSSAAAGTTVTTLDIPIDSPEDGDLILLATGRATAPGGWTLLGDAHSGGTHLRVYSKVSDGTETAVTISGSSDVMAGITVITNAREVVAQTRTDVPMSSTSFETPAAIGAALVSFAIFDGPGYPPDEHITGADTTVLENVKVQAGGLYGLAAATGRATFTSTAGSGTSLWVGVTVGAVT